MSISLEADFCIEAVEEALARYGQSGIVNTDQASQLAPTDLIKGLASREIRISMDGKGAWRDNVFVERLWRKIKYEEVYLKAYGSVPEVRVSIGHSLAHYNSRRRIHLTEEPRIRHASTRKSRKRLRHDREPVPPGE